MATLAAIGLFKFKPCNIEQVTLALGASALCQRYLNVQPLVGNVLADTGIWACAAGLLRTA